MIAYSINIAYFVGILIYLLLLGELVFEQTKFKIQGKIFWFTLGIILCPLWPAFLCILLFMIFFEWLLEVKE